MPCPSPGETGTDIIKNGEQERRKGKARSKGKCQRRYEDMTAAAAAAMALAKVGYVAT